MDLWGESLWDFHQGKNNDPLYLDTSYGPRETVPLGEFFRNDHSFTALDQAALSYCQGPVLDVGAGSGSHALALQNSGISVTALEISSGACRVMRSRGVINIVNGDIYRFKGKYRTLLLLMNGVGLAGTLSNLNRFLGVLKELLVHQGQILIDSCDVGYLFEGHALPQDRYFGELNYQYHYKNRSGSPFPWLFVDAEKLQEYALRQELRCQIVFQEGDQYLALLNRM